MITSNERREIMKHGINHVGSSGAVFVYCSTVCGNFSNAIGDITKVDCPSCLRIMHSRKAVMRKPNDNPTLPATEEE